MNILLLIISHIFFGILFLFHKMNELTIFNKSEINIIHKGFSSITGGILYDSLLFSMAGVFLFFLFTKFQFFKKNDELSIEKLEQIGTEGGEAEGMFGQKYNKEKIIDIVFKKYIYQLGFLILYIATYLILQGLGIENISSIILFFNIIVGVTLFVWTTEVEFFRDFIRVNTMLFSLFYVSLYLYEFIFGGININGFDIINTIFIFVFFGIIFYIDSKFLKKDKEDSGLIIYFIIYTYIIMSFYGKILVGNGVSNMNQIHFYIPLFFHFTIYYILQKIKFLQLYKYLLRGVSLLFIYGAVTMGASILAFQYREINIQAFIIIGCLIYASVFNFIIHKKYQNYISLGLAVLSTVFVLFYLLFSYYNYKNTTLSTQGILVLGFSISFYIVFYTYYAKQKHKIDYYVLYVFSYVVAIISIGYYFMMSEWRKLDFGMILLLFSILIFFSFFRIKKVREGGIIKT